jgi:hypothetical protein
VVSTPAPITQVQVPTPLSSPVSMPIPVTVATQPLPATASQDRLAAVSPAITTRFSPVPVTVPALPVVTQPTVGALERLPQPVPMAPAGLEVRLPAQVVVLPGRLTPRLELSNGNGVQGIATRLSYWLQRQGVKTDRLTNQTPFTAPSTAIYFRDGHQDAARRLARSLPVVVSTLLAPETQIDSELRVVLGHDWLRTAACLQRNSCPAPATVAAALQ